MICCLAIFRRKCELHIFQLLAFFIFLLLFDQSSFSENTILPLLCLISSLFSNFYSSPVNTLLSLFLLFPFCLTLISLSVFHWFLFFSLISLPLFNWLLFLFSTVYSSSFPLITLPLFHWLLLLFFTDFSLGVLTSSLL